MRTRLVLVLAFTVFAAVPANAANAKPQIVDSPSDSVGGQPGAEIVSALWTTTGVTVTRKERGRRVRRYTPKNLVVTLNLAGAPYANGFAYETSAVVAGCGDVRFTYTPGAAVGEINGYSLVWFGCGEGDSVNGPGETIKETALRLGPKSVTWEFPLADFGKNVKVGAPVTSFRAAVGVVEPVLGYFGTTNVQPLDEGLGKGPWPLGS